MSKSRKTKNKPGKKSGNRINQTLVTKPLGMRNMIDYELPTRLALIAMAANKFNGDNLGHLYSLGDMCQRITTEQHIKLHSGTVMYLCQRIRNEHICDKNTAYSIGVSVNLLMDWLNTQSNGAISKATHDAIREMA